MDPSKLSNAQVTFIKDESGDTITTMAPNEETAAAWKTASRQIYKNDDGQWVASPQASVTMSANGDINVIAPKSYFENDSLKSLLDESTLSQISKLYKANSEAKISNPFSSDSGEQITIPEFISAFDTALKDYADIQHGTDVTRYFHRENLGDKAKDLTENQYIMMNTTATEPGAKDSSYLSMPSAVLDAFPSLKNKDSYKNNFLTRGDFLNFYNLDNTSREDIHKIHDIVDEYFAKKDFSDLDEYSRMYAFRRFIKTVEPSAGFWSSAGLTAEAGVTGVVTGVGKFATGTMNLLEMAWNGIMAVNQLRPMFFPITMATGGIKAPGEALGSSSFFKGLDEGLQQHISEQQQDYYELQHGAASVYMIAEIGGEIGANIATGKAVANVLSNTALLNVAVQQAESAKVGAEALYGAKAGLTAEQAVMKAVTGTPNPSKLQLLKTIASADGSDIYNAINTMMSLENQTAYGLQTAFNIAGAETMAQYQAGNIAGAVSAGERTLALKEAGEQIVSSLSNSAQVLKDASRAASIENFFAQVAVDTASQDALMLRKFLDGDPDAADAGEVLWRVGTNAGIYAAALGLGRLITKFPATETGQKANEAAREKVASIGESVQKWNDDLKDHLPAVIKNKMPSQSASSKRAAQYSDLLRGANKIVAETGDATKKVAMEAALDNMWFGTNNRVAQYYSDYYPFMNQANTARAGAEKELTKLMNNYSIAPEAPIATLGKDVASNLGVPQDLINYAYDLDMVRRASTYTPEAIAEELKYGRDIAKSKEVAEARIARVKEKYPAQILDYIESTWAPAYKELAYQANRIAKEKKVLNEPWYNKVVESGHFGDNGELWFPSRTITQWQEMQMNARNSLSRELVGDVPNRNQPEQWSYSYDGKEHNYVHPGIVVDGYVNRIASRDLRREGLKAGLDIYGQDVLFTGDQNAAAEAYRKNRSAIKKASDAAIGKVSHDLASSGLATDIAVDRDIKKLQKKIAKKEEKIVDLKTGVANVKVNKSDITNVINSIDSTTLETMLGDEAIAKITQTSEQWDEFWKTASRPERRMIRESLEKTADQTGFIQSPDETSVANKQERSIDQELIANLNEAIAADAGKKAALRTKGAISYDQFQKGMQFDPELETRLNRAILNNKIKKECK